MQKKSLLFSKAAILSSVILFNLCSNAFGQCPVPAQISGNHTVSTSCYISQNVVVISGGHLAFNGPIEITFAQGVSITVNSGGQISGTNTTFKPGQGVSSWGGIRITGGTPSFTNCKFYDAEKSGSGNCDEANSGGAIYSTNGKLKVENCRFENCQTTSGGGAILFHNGSKGIIIDSYFVGNKCNRDHGGGAIAILQESDVRIIECTFDGNIAQSTVGPCIPPYLAKGFNDGGAIVVRCNSGASQPSKAFIEKCTFLNNASISGTLTMCSPPLLVPGQGGAIANIRSEVTIFESEFTNNESEVGGAVYCSSFGKTAITQLNSCTFQENSASTHGGAVYSSTGIGLPSTNCSLFIEQCTFNLNTAINNGGALYMEAYSKNHETTIKNSTFNENSSEGNGGAIYSVADAGGTSLVSIEQNCEFQKNSSENGGAIANIRSDFEISQSLFNENTATYYGGAIYSATGTTGAPSGVIAANSNTELSECTLTDNAAINGGAVYCESSPYDYNQTSPFHLSSLMISSNTEFTGNTAVLKGGAISMLRSKADISETTFSGNLTNDEDGGGYGGAFYSSKNRGEIKFVECTFEENSSDIGGAIAIQSSIWDYPHENRPNNILIEESDFRLNSTTSNSDAMGGAVYIGDYPSTSSYPEIQTLDGLLIQGNEFDHNNSPDGGAFCLNNMDGQGSIAASFLILWNIFLNNIASSTGGAMVLNDMNYGEIDFFLNRLTGNSSASHGGGIYMSYVENFNCINNLIAENLTDNGHGAGVFASNSDCLAFGSNTIANNGSNGYNGGGIYFSTSNTNSPFPVIFNSIIWGNSPNSLYDATYSNYWDYCQDSDIEGIGGQGQNNIDVDTEFTDPSNGDYTLDCEASPCVNAGNNFFFHTDYDLLLNDRIDNNPHVIDMGAYECPTPDAKRKKNEKTSREISIFPNPFNGELSVQSPEPIVQIRLYSITGQLMLIERPVKSTHSIICPECPAGVYMLHITTISKNYVKRVVKTDKQ